MATHTYNPQINARAYSTERLAARLAELLKLRFAGNGRLTSVKRYQESAAIALVLRARKAESALCDRLDRLGPEVPLPKSAPRERAPKKAKSSAALDFLPLFACQHPRIRDNIQVAKYGSRCLTCNRARDTARRQAA